MKTKVCFKCKVEKEISEFHEKDHGKRHSPWCKKCFSRYCRDRWKSIKLKAISLFDSRCCKCGYNKNLSSLDFHHMEPDKKEYNWNRLCKRPWEEIVSELKKCILVCRNCHSELHNPELEIVKMDRKILLLDKERIVYLNPTGKCERHGCGNDVYGTKYCSSACAHICQRRVKRPSKEKLRNMIKRTSWSEIGRQYGVSDNAIRKWAKAYKINA